MKITDQKFIRAVDQAPLPPLVRGQILGVLRASEVDPAAVSLSMLEKAGIPAALREGVLFQLRCAALPGLDPAALGRSTAEVAAALAKAGLDDPEAAGKDGTRHNVEQALRQIAGLTQLADAGAVKQVRSKDELDQLVEMLAAQASQSEIGALLGRIAHPVVKTAELSAGKTPAISLGDGENVLSLYRSMGGFFLQSGATTQAERYFNPNMLALGYLDLPTSAQLLQVLDELLSQTKGKQGAHPAITAAAEASELPGFLQTFRAAVVEHQAQLRAELRGLAEDMARIDGNLRPTDKGTWLVTEAFQAPIDYMSGDGPGGYESVRTGWLQVGERNRYRMMIPAGAELFTQDAHPGAYFREGGTERGAWIRYQEKIYRVEQDTRGSQSDGGGLQYHVNGLEQMSGLDLAECRRFNVPFPAHWFPADNGGSIYDWEKWK